jgi:hypothetical protein
MLRFGIPRLLKDVTDDIVLKTAQHDWKSLKVAAQLTPNRKLL